MDEEDLPPQRRNLLQIRRKSGWRDSEGEFDSGGPTRGDGPVFFIFYFFKKKPFCEWRRFNSSGFLDPSYPMWEKGLRKGDSSTYGTFNCSFRQPAELRGRTPNAVFCEASEPVWVEADWTARLPNLRAIRFSISFTDIFLRNFSIFIYFIAQSNCH